MGFCKARCGVGASGVGLAHGLAKTIVCECLAASEDVFASEGVRLPDGARSGSLQIMSNKQHEQGLISVGKLLIATAQGKGEYKDVFLRSSVSRFYYALYLRVRCVVTEVTELDKLGHAAVPGILQGKVRKRFRRQLEKARTMGIISRERSSNISNRVNSHTLILAQIMTRANRARTVADYDIGSPVFEQDGVFYIDKIPISDLRNNYEDARTSCDALLTDWGRLGGA